MCVCTLHADTHRYAKATVRSMLLIAVIVLSAPSEISRVLSATSPAEMLGVSASAGVAAVRAAHRAAALRTLLH